MAENDDTHTRPIVTRAEAKAAGLKRYRDGKPCLRGHTGERRVSSSNCCVCELLANAAWREANREKMRRAKNAWCAKNREYVRAASADYEKKNKDSIRIKKSLRRQQNKEALSKRIAAQRAANPEKFRAWSRAWQRSNPGALAAANRFRKLAKINATPPWVDRKALRAIYVECARISRETGVMHHVDHIIPLRNPNVCGLHVVANLRIVTAEENFKKNNRLIEELAA